MDYNFDHTKHTPLCAIMGNNRSDKGSIHITSSWHNYTTFYHKIFNSRANNPMRVFELGIGTNNIAIPSNMGVKGRPGASLYGWSEYFPNSQIFGADIDKNILFATDRIKTFYCDQTDPMVIKEMFAHKDLEEPFDIMIEDGLHTFNANVCFFENSIHKLKSNGYYIIEDVITKEIPLFENKISEWVKLYPDLTFNILPIKSTCNFIDNNLIVIYKK